MQTSPSLFSLPSCRVLAFVRGWSIEALDAQTVQALRERIRSLGAELIVLSDRGAWAFNPDDDTFGEYRDRIAGDLATATTLLSPCVDQNAVFVLDGAHVIRVGHEAANLPEALDAAAELLVMRRLDQVTQPRRRASLVRWAECAS